MVDEDWVNGCANTKQMLNWQNFQNFNFNFQDVFTFKSKFAECENYLVPKAKPLMIWIECVAYTVFCMHNSGKPVEIRSFANASSDLANKPIKLRSWWTPAHSCHRIEDLLRNRKKMISKNLHCVQFFLIANLLCWSMRHPWKFSKAETENKPTESWQQWQHKSYESFSIWSEDQIKSNWTRQSQA